MKEIEVKIKVNSFESIENKLKELGCNISDPIIQNDIVFFDKNYDGKTRNVLRIRTVDDKSILTFKRSAVDELSCIEKEVEIKNPEIMIEMIDLLGYEEYVRVNKKRRKCNYKNYEICLDDVETLGLYIEVEKMSDEDQEIVKKELVDFLLSLGVDVSGRVLKGYDTLVIEKQNEK